MIRGTGCLAAALLSLSFAAVASVARAAPTSVSSPYSPYELESIHDAEKTLRTTLDPSPEGKIIERIDLVRLDPIEPRDPAPLALDLLHATSRESVIRKEVLVR